MDPASLNEHLRDPAIRVIHLDGDHRLVDGLDLAAVRADPKPIVGTGGATFVQLQLWRECRLVGYHGEGEIRPGPLRLTGRTWCPAGPKGCCSAAASARCAR